MKKHGFRHFVGLDGSKNMLELAKNTGHYVDVKQCMLGDDELPVQWGKVVHNKCISDHMKHVQFPPTYCQYIYDGF